MNVRAKARRPLGLLVSAAAIAIFFVTAVPAGAQDSTADNNGQGEDHANCNGQGNGNGNSEVESQGNGNGQDNCNDKGNCDGNGHDDNGHGNDDRVENNGNGNGHDLCTASVHGDCDGGFAVTIKNDSKHDVDALIRLNGVDTVVEVPKDSSLTMQPLALNEDIPNTILVMVGEKILLQKSFSVNCLADPEATLSASISSDCGSFVVTVKNDGDADGSVTVTVNGSSVTLDVAAGKTVTMTIAVTEDADNTIAVTAGDADLAHKTFHVDCKQDVPAPTSTVAPPATDVPAAPAAPAPAVQVLGETVQQPTTLAFTGRNTLFETMIGVLLLGFGLQLMRSSRRLEQNS
jgi:hypothetical protein